MIEDLERLGSPDYDEYLTHQASNTEIPQHVLDYYETRYYLELGQRLQRFGNVRPGMSVLCLAARLGAEVKAFINHGCFAVGLDLNPGEGNRYVVHGDFHRLQYANDSVDVVFTNSVDHVFNLGIFIGEILRVLKPDGLLIMDIVKGRDDGVEPDQYASLWWGGIDDLLAVFLAGRIEPFDLIHRSDFEWPWAGQHVILKRR